MAAKLSVRSSDVKDVIVWGNCSSTASLESVNVGLDSGRVHSHDGAIIGPTWFSRPVLEVVDDK